MESFCWRSRGIKFNKNGNVQTKHFSPLFNAKLEDKLSINGEIVFLDMDVEVLDKSHALKMETKIFKIIIRTHYGDHAIITSATNGSLEKKMSIFSKPTT
jgi:hypothetical protein